MTSPEGPEPITSPGIHDMPREQLGPPLTPQQWKKFGTVFVNRMLATVLYALSGIQILGGNPFGFLRAFADELAKRADDAYAGATNAQNGADVANIEIAIIKADLAADKVGGQAISDPFDGPEAHTLNPVMWVQRYFDSGVGDFGLDGEGNARWFTSGGGLRTCVCRHVESLDTDDQAVTLLLKGVPVSTNGALPHVDLRVRSNDNDASNTCVLARLRKNQVEIGYMLAGDYTRLGAVESLAMSGNQTYQLKARTDGTTHYFELLQDNVVKVVRTSPTTGPTAYGGTFRHPGFAVRAGTNFVYPLFYQTGPPRIQVFSAADI